MPLLLVVVAVAVVGSTFEVLTNRRDRKAEIEDGATPLHNEICDARIDLKNWSLPLVIIWSALQKKFSNLIDARAFCCVRMLPFL